MLEELIEATEGASLTHGCQQRVADPWDVLTNRHLSDTVDIQLKKNDDVSPTGPLGNVSGLFKKDQKSHICSN
jgi:hypothetical protein